MMQHQDNKIEREKEFHNRRYGDGNKRRQQVGKFYSITSSITKAYQHKLLSNSQNSKVIEYGCGEGSYAFKIANNQAKSVVGIDISSVALAHARQQAAAQNLNSNLQFKVMNAENLEFPPDSYDLICGSGILHHLDLNSAINSIVRTLKADGKAIFVEPLGHNILINMYRRLTPNIRSEDEHPLLEADLKTLKNNFKNSNISYFYLTSLMASLLVGKPGFKTLLSCCQWLDEILLKLPGIRQQAWMVLIELEQPKK